MWLLTVKVRLTREKEKISPRTRVETASHSYRFVRALSRDLKNDTQNQHNSRGPSALSYPVVEDSVFIKQSLSPGTRQATPHVMMIEFRLVSRPSRRTFVELWSGTSEYRIELP